MSREKILFYEIPLLFENKLSESFDLNVYVSLSKNLQVRRLIKRDNFTLEQAHQRIDSQLPDEIKRKKADLIIDNNGNLENLYSQLNILNQLLGKLTKRNVIPLR